MSVGYLEELLGVLGWASEAQRAVDIHNNLRQQLEPIFIQEQIRKAFRAPTLEDALLAAEHITAFRAARP